MKTKNIKSKWNPGRLAVLTVLAGSCIGLSVQKSAAVIDGGGGYHPLQDGNIIQIVNIQNNEEIHANVPNGNAVVGADVYQQARVGDYWTFYKNSDGTWSIVSLDTGNLALDDGNSTANNAHVIQYTNQRSNNNQHWYVDLQSDGTYKITNKASGKVLDSGSRSGNGIPVVQYTSNNGKQQRWQLYDPRG